MITRMRVKRVDDSGPQQLVDLHGGLPGQAYTQVHRLQFPGMSTVPVEGAEVAVLTLGGPTQLIALGGELPEARPTDQLAGAKTLYGANGQRLTLSPNGTVERTADGTPKVLHAETLHIVASELIIHGGLTVTGQIKHNGIAQGVVPPPLPAIE